MGVERYGGSIIDKWGIDVVSERRKEKIDPFLLHAFSWCACCL